jgi:hypothetical protein
MVGAAQVTDSFPSMSPHSRLGGLKIDMRVCGGKLNDVTPRRAQHGTRTLQRTGQRKMAFPSDRAVLPRLEYELSGRTADGLGRLLL